MPDAIPPPALLRVLAGERLDPPPLWLMRQAGRYLPEYRALRADKGGFLDLVYDPPAACEVTLQPLRRFRFDAAILFADILIVPHALGQHLTFGVGEGPKLTPPLADARLDGLTPDPSRLAPVIATARAVRAALDPHIPLIGFAGSPWTVATYMVEGGGSRDQAATRTLATRDPAAFQPLIDTLVAATIDYLADQVDAGAAAVQLFDSWAGHLSPALFERFVIAPNAAIVAGLLARQPHVRIIGFPKGAGAKLIAYAHETGVDGVGLDETVDPAWADANLPRGMPVQGNLDPLALLAGGAALDEGIARVRHAFDDRPHVFNLGHGILQQTPIAHVEHLVASVRSPR